MIRLRNTTVACLLAAALLQGATPAAKYRSGTVLVAFNDNVSENMKFSWYSQTGGSEQRRMGQGVHMLQVPVGWEASVIQFLKATGGVKYAELDYQHTTSGGAIPNDPGFANQWGLLNTGQLVNGYSGPAGADVKAVPAWSVTTGTNSVVVAVLDSGAQYTHPDLFTNIWSNPGTINGCAAGTHGYNVLALNCDPMDDESWYGGHGTHVAGIIGATGNSGAGIAGASWTTSILPVKWISSNSTGYTSDLISAMDWVIRAKQAGVNVKVVNDSATWPGDAFSQALSDEIDALGANDILFVSAAGNGSTNIDVTPVYPCAYKRPTQICVAALDMDLSLWVASNWGATSVHMGAPGAAIYSTLRQSNYGIISGASMSTALVSGAAALVLSNGNLPVASLKSTLLSAVTQQPSLVGRTVTGGSLNLCSAFPTCGSSPAAPQIQDVPVVTGVPVFGSVAGASTGKWSGLPTSFSYQWLRCDGHGANCLAIAGATAQAYGMFGAMDAGATLAVSVTASNSLGSATGTSAASAVVAGSAPPFTINSTIANGSVLTSSVAWQASSSQAMSFVEFYIDGALSQTATIAPFYYNESSNSLFDPTKLTPGAHTLGLRGLATDNRTYSYYAAAVTVGAGPVNTALPSISGTLAIASTLLVSNGNWTGSPTGYSYQWLRCDGTGNNCANISGATASSYVVAMADANSSLRSTVTASNASGSTPARSAAVLIPAPVVSTATLPSGVVGSAYSGQLAARGGTSPYKWSVISGSLPGGLSLNAGTGLISGTPLSGATFSFTVQVTDSFSNMASKALSITIAGAMAPMALVQSNSIEGKGATSVSATFGMANTSGNLIVAFVRMSSTGQTVSLSDSLGNTYASAVSQVQSADGHQTYILYAKNVRAGSNTVRATFSGANNHPFLAIYEFAGLSATNPLDQTASGQAVDSASIVVSPRTTGTANELIFMGAGFPYSWGGNVTAGGGFTMGLQDIATSRAASEFRIVSATGSYSGGFGLSALANWSGVLATFR
jgi:subtilisin family serine protease